jgi:hypothetical protein
MRGCALGAAWPSWARVRKVWVPVCLGGLEVVLVSVQEIGLESGLGA